jgi:hypothetical protein
MTTPKRFEREILKTEILKTDSSQLSSLGDIAAGIALGGGSAAMVALPCFAKKNIAGFLCGINLMKAPPDIVQAALRLAALLETPPELIEAVREAIAQAPAAPAKKEPEVRFL